MRFTVEGDSNVARVTILFKMARRWSRQQYNVAVNADFVCKSPLGHLDWNRKGNQISHKPHYSLHTNCVVLTLHWRTWKWHTTPHTFRDGVWWLPSSLSSLAISSFPPTSSSSSRPHPSSNPPDIRTSITAAWISHSPYFALLTIVLIQLVEWGVFVTHICMRRFDLMRPNRGTLRSQLSWSGRETSASALSRVHSFVPMTLTGIIHSLLNIPQWRSSRVTPHALTHRNVDLRSPQPKTRRMCISHSKGLTLRNNSSLSTQRSPVMVVHKLVLPRRGSDDISESEPVERANMIPQQEPDQRCDHAFGTDNRLIQDEQPCFRDPDSFLSFESDESRENRLPRGMTTFAIAKIFETVSRNRGCAVFHPIAAVNKNKSISPMLLPTGCLIPERSLVCCNIGILGWMSRRSNLTSIQLLIPRCSLPFISSHIELSKSTYVPSFQG